jgi:hypothetical protein
VSRIALACGIALAASACWDETAPVDKPCGVLADSLRNVRGATPADTRRIDIHFERGVAAGCWRRR